jgi:hypothetical protein
MKTITGLVNWLLSKTKIGQYFNGHKTEIGFCLWLLGYLIDGLAYAASVFPEVPGLGVAAASLNVLRAQLSEVLKQFGLGVMVVGVGHKAIKANEPT